MCNCWTYTKSQFENLPSTNIILSNLSATGSVAVFYYADVGLHHYAVVRKETEDFYLIEETNYHRCQHGFRTISKDDKSLIGFFSPASL